MARWFPPKPKIRPLVRRTLMAAALGAAGCGGATPQHVRIGPPPPPPQPQQAWAEFAGQIRGPGGEPVANASIRVVVDGEERVIATDSEGYYYVDGLAPGDHTVVFHATGYQPREVTVDPGSNHLVVVDLQPEDPATQQ